MEAGCPAGAFAVRGVPVPKPDYHCTNRGIVQNSASKLDPSWDFPGLIPHTGPADST